MKRILYSHRTQQIKMIRSRKTKKLQDKRCVFLYFVSLLRLLTDNFSTRLFFLVNFGGSIGLWGDRFLLAFMSPRRSTVVLVVVDFEGAIFVTGLHNPCRNLSVNSGQNWGMVTNVIIIFSPFDKSDLNEGQMHGSCLSSNGSLRK